MSLSIEGEKFKVELFPTSSLLPHEETVPNLLNSLIQQMKNDGVQRDPIIVEKDNYIVLDGMHRLGALKSIGIENVVCHIVDYSSQDIQVQRWLRAVRIADYGIFRHMLENLKIDKVTTLSEAVEAVDSGKGIIAVLTSDRCYVSSHAMSIPDSYSLLRQIDRVTEMIGWKYEFIQYDEIDLELIKPRSAVIVPPRLGKRDVVEAALKGKLLPYKSTMHIVNPRILGLNYPLSELKKQNPSREILIRKLSSKFKAIEPPSEYMGRRYKERILVMEE